MTAPRSVLLLFLDGVGIGPDDPDRNPFLRSELPTLRTLGGGRVPTLDDPRVGTDRSRFLPLDASLGVAGVPQSGTGQVALLTGLDAPGLHGGHFGPWVPVSLRPALERENVLSTARSRGVPTAFANAYPRRFLDAPLRRWAAPPLAARAAGLLVRHEEALRAGEAVASELDNEAWTHRLGVEGLPDIDAREAGRRLGRIAAGHGFTLFAHYATDLAGHRGGMAGAVLALERVDSFLAGVLETLPEDCLLVVGSDHGNIEEVGVGHTLNPALGLLAWSSSPPDGPLPATLRDLAPAILRWLPAAAPPLQDGG